LTEHFLQSSAWVYTAGFLQTDSLGWVWTVVFLQADGSNWCAGLLQAVSLLQEVGSIYCPHPALHRQAHGRLHAVDLALKRYLYNTDCDVICVVPCCQVHAIRKENLLDSKGLAFYYDEIHPDGNTGHR
jgi:hypothetical protein